MFENAARLRGRGRVEARADAFGANDDQFAGLDVAVVDSADQIESAGFRGENNRLAPFAGPSRDVAHGEGTESTRIAGSEDAVAGDHHQRKGAFHAAQRIRHGIR